MLTARCIVLKILFQTWKIQSGEPIKQVITQRALKVNVASRNTERKRQEEETSAVNKTNGYKGREYGNTAHIRL